MQTETTLQEEIQKLENQLTGDMFKDMEVKGKDLRVIRPEAI